MNISIRLLTNSDSQMISDAFARQGWVKPVEQYDEYYIKQQRGDFQLYIAEADGVFAGYLILAKSSKHGPFENRNLPEIRDFNVLERYQRNGIGSRLLDFAENLAAQYSDVVTLGVGMHSGYGAAQRLYVKHGYIPDGSGIWYRDVNIRQGDECRNDDDLVIYLYKNLK